MLENEGLETHHLSLHVGSLKEKVHHRRPVTGI